MGETGTADSHQQLTQALVHSPELDSASGVAMVYLEQTVTPSQECTQDVGAGGNSPRVVRGRGGAPLASSAFLEALSETSCVLIGSLCSQFLEMSLRSDVNGGWYRGTSQRLRHTDRYGIVRNMCLM